MATKDSGTARGFTASGVPFRKWDPEAERRGIARAAWKDMVAALPQDQQRRVKADPRRYGWR